MLNAESIDPTPPRAPRSKTSLCDLCLIQCVRDVRDVRTEIGEARLLPPLRGDRGTGLVMAVGELLQNAGSRRGGQSKEIPTRAQPRARQRRH